MPEAHYMAYIGFTYRYGKLRALYRDIRDLVDAKSVVRWRNGRTFYLTRTSYVEVRPNIGTSTGSGLMLKVVYENRGFAVESIKPERYARDFLVTPRIAARAIQRLEGVEAWLGRVLRALVRENKQYMHRHRKDLDYLRGIYSESGLDRQKEKLEDIPF